jgi:hypothetical protein
MNSKYKTLPLYGRKTETPIAMKEERISWLLSSIHLEGYSPIQKEKKLNSISLSALRLLRAL